MLEQSLIADLVTELPAAVRLQRLVSTLRSHFNCGAVGLLRLEHDSRAAIKALSQGAPRSDIATLEAALLDIDTVSAAIVHTELHGNTVANGITLKQAVSQLQRQMVQQALTQHDGSWSQAARQLELDPSNLHKLAQRLGLK